eukprot:TRINITY_DN8475_c0_g1_i1.p1 TRINITY_DN8475_c0_g1~~TRINITY_DN8475_c0_g1_i1.p1  ORF type:complete len:228 (-),score=2.09 TRINITY_DN8475_c0_g1_i1:10-693(-)
MATTTVSKAILDVGHEVREIGHLAVWSVTSAKPGNGVELLRDGNKDTYWQSDGTQPHLVDIQFQKKMQVQEVALYLDYRLDESYTPKLISIRAGNSLSDMTEIHSQELEEPHGWTRIKLNTQHCLQGAYLRAFCLQLAVLSNHQNGRDTHIRQIKVFGPRVDPLRAIGFPLNFTDDSFLAYATVRQRNVAPASVNQRSACSQFCDAWDTGQRKKERTKKIEYHAPDK